MPDERKRSKRGMFGLAPGVPAIVVLAAAIGLGRLAADRYAEAPAARVGVIALVVSFALAGLAGAYGCDALPGPAVTPGGFRAAAAVGFGAVAANYALGLALVRDAGLVAYFAAAEVFWLGLLYAACVAPAA